MLQCHNLVAHTTKRLEQDFGLCTFEVVSPFFHFFSGPSQQVLLGQVIHKHQAIRLLINRQVVYILAVYGDLLRAAINEEEILERDSLFHDHKLDLIE